MSDDNIIEFKNKTKNDNGDNLKEIQTRVMECMSKSNCQCKYCNYKKGAVEMVLEFMAMDIMNFEKTSKAIFCTYDLKEILFETIMKIKEMEKEIDESKK